MQTESDQLYKNNKHSIFLSSNEILYDNYKQHFAKRINANSSCSKEL